MSRSRLTMTLVPLLLAALPVAAELVKYKNWDDSPEYVYLATEAEKKEWKAVKTDDEAEKFVALFWARRDPDIKNPQNEFRMIFDARAKKADELFALGKKRGALTERGKLFILVGPPKSIGQKVDSSLNQAPGAASSLEGGGGFITGGGVTSVMYQFLYEKPQLPEWADVHTLDAKFQVDKGTNTEYLLDPGTVKRLENKAVEMAIKNPDLKEVPVYKTKEQFEAEQKAAAAAAADAAKGPALTPALRQTLEGLLGADAKGGITLFPLAYRDGATRLMVQVHASASDIPVPDGVKLVLLARAKDGSDAARVEEPITLQKAKGEWFGDKSLPVPPGDYDVAAAFVDPAGTVLATAKGTVTVPALPTEFGSSALLLAYTDYPADGSKPDDPFVFSVRKFATRPGNAFDKADGVSYMARIYNPSVDPATGKISLKRSIRIKPKTGAPIDVPLPPDEPIPVPPQTDPKAPKQALVLDLAGAIVDANIGQYFKPGEYSLRLTVTDTVSGKTIEAASPFTVVGPATPAPSTAPAPKKKG